jgi:hypothetical protein
MTTARASCIALAAVLAPLAAGAPRDSSPAARGDSAASAFRCAPGLTGSAGRDSAEPAGGPPRVAMRAAIDTVITLAIADRSWTRDDVHAGVALGASGPAGGRAPWRACAGATVQLGRVTARLRQVHGTVHLRIDPAALDSVGRASVGPSPAGPPRR